MKAVVRTTLPVAFVALVLTAAAISAFRGVTEPNVTVLGMTSRHADIAGCWAVFLGLPVACAVDAARIDRASWSRARRSKPAWISVVAYLPALGPLLYVVYARPKVAGATARSRGDGPGEPPIGEHI
jgi:hypothetical protein